MHILITGSNGQLGSELFDRSKDNPQHTYVFVDVDVLDITDRAAVDAFFRAQHFDACINCAAYTAVDKAESNESLAFDINVTGVENLARACSAHGATLYHISTDFVFDGQKGSPYTVDDPVEPLSVYGRTKAEGEYRAFMVCSNTILIRTSWVYSFYGNNFVKTMIRLGKEKESIQVVDDQTGSPTYAYDLAKVLFVALEKQGAVPPGIYHFTDAGSTTWFGFAQKIMELYGLPCVVHPIPTSGYPTPAQRPAYSVLDCSLIQQTLNIEIPHWELALEQCISRLKNETDA
ncbi:MAG: dTDP-4-dehydrorhamnose reductase [Chitinophagales bacterium]